jgi:hypothetical protein
MTKLNGEMKTLDQLKKPRFEFHEYPCRAQCREENC